MSKLLPLLKTKSTRLIGIGLEKTGAEEFVKDKYFAGELYIDFGQQSYKDLEFRRFGFCEIITGVVCSSEYRLAKAEAMSQNLTSNLRGDGLLNGGLLVVDTGGEVLYSYKQILPMDHANNLDILNALGIYV